MYGGRGRKDHRANVCMLGSSTCEGWEVCVGVEGGAGGGLQNRLLVSCIHVRATDPCTWC